MFHFWPSVLLFFPSAHALDAFMMCGYLAVPMFFVLSGYVIGLRYLQPMLHPTRGKLRQFFLLRLARVYPVHLATLAITLVINCRHGWPTDAGHSVERLARNLTLTHAWDQHFWVSWNFPSWSISSEWFAYLIFPAVAMGVGRLAEVTARSIACASAALGAFVYYFGEPFPWFGLAAVAPCFAGGVVLARCYPPASGPSSARPRAVAILVAATLVMPFLLPLAARAPALVLLFFLLVGILGRQGHNPLSPLEHPSLVWLGEVSYSLYMTHAIAITVVTRFFTTRAESSVPLKVAWCAAAAASMLLATIAMYYAVERPARRALRRALRQSRIDAGAPGSSAVS